MRVISRAKKVEALECVLARSGWPRKADIAAYEKFSRGMDEHQVIELVHPHEHVEERPPLDVVKEAEEECYDLAGYGALALCQGQWTWRWWIVGWLAGICWRVLQGARAKMRASITDDGNGQDE